ncbi:MAG: hypothetical protein ACQER9_00075 [Nanobdellota archaeon]
MKNKKSMQMSLQTVIVGVILLLVLAVIIYIFTSRMGEQNEAVGDLQGSVTDKCIDEDGNIKEDCEYTKNLNEGYIIPLIPFIRKKYFLKRT